jgi:PIN domain nuclease of toxin-antitoxin system
MWCAKPPPVSMPVSHRQRSSRRQSAWAAAALPPLHADPFDRELVAQARVEHLTLATRDDRMRGYQVQVLWA